MDERNSNESIPEVTTNSGSQSTDGLSFHSGLKNAIGAVVAITVVVGLHFGFPVLVAMFVTGISFRIDSIIILLIAILSIIFVPIGGTTLILGLIGKLLGSTSREPLSQWPWKFATPSIIGFLMFLTMRIWWKYIPQEYIAMEFIQLPQMNIETGILALTGVILLFTETSLGVTDQMSSRVSREASESRAENNTPQQERSRNRNRHHEIEFVTRGQSSFDWQEAPDMNFEEVGGLEKEKSTIYRRVISPLLTDKDAYHRFRVSPPTGILLFGPPGTGKSYLARAIAGELGSPYVELSQADLTSMWINESPKKIRRLFDEAEQFEFSVIFIDEIDGLIATRDSSGHREDSKVISELLARLGEEVTKYLIIAATNRPDQLDSAFLRAGRFDEQFEIGFPGAQAREEIFKVQLRNRRPSVTESEYRLLGEQSDGFTPADIASVVERAALSAAERDAPSISFEDLSMHL